MIISNCPRCHEGFRVPSGPIPDDAYAHCPWCRETFPITEVLRSLPPQLEIVSADGRPLVIGQPASGISSGLQLIDASRRPPSVKTVEAVIDDRVGDDHRLYDTDDEDDANATVADETMAETIVDDNWHQEATFARPGRGPSELRGASHSDDDPYSTWDGTEQSPLQSMNVSTKNNGRRKKGSGIGTFLGIVLGGLASVPIAGGLLAMMGRTPDWGFWPFNGEQRSVSIRAAAPLPESETRLNSTSPSGTPLRFDSDPLDVDSSEDPAESAVEEIVRADVSEVDQTVELTQSAKPPVTESTAATPTVEVSSAIDENTPSAIDKKTFNASRMVDAMSRYQGSDVERRRRMGVTYQEIASAAGSADQPGTLLQGLASKIATSPIQAEIRSAGWIWLASENRPSDGIALIGRASVSDEGTFLTSDSGTMIELLFEGEIPDAQEVLVLGRLVDQDSSLRVVHVEPVLSGP